MSVVRKGMERGNAFLRSFSKRSLVANVARRVHCSLASPLCFLGEGEGLGWRKARFLRYRSKEFVSPTTFDRVQFSYITRK